MKNSSYIIFFKILFISFFDNVPRMKIHTVETIESCLHEVVLPPNFEYVPLKAPVGPPAKEYKFNLDPFQREAISCLQNNQSVLVSAHTSAGKTVVAEYVKYLFAYSFLNVFLFLDKLDMLLQWE